MQPVAKDLFANRRETKKRIKQLTRPICLHRQRLKKLLKNSLALPSLPPPLRDVIYEWPLNKCWPASELVLTPGWWSSRWRAGCKRSSRLSRNPPGTWWRRSGSRGTGRWLASRGKEIELCQRRRWPEIKTKLILSKKRLCLKLLLSIFTCDMLTYFM